MIIMGIRSLRDIRRFLLLLAAITSINALKCSRLIEGTTMPRSNADGKYHLFITLFNRTEMVFSYMPNTRYSVTVQADRMGIIPRKFTRFLISSEPENEQDTTESGIFDLQDDLLTKYSENCPNTVVEMSMVSKEEISVAWTSPSEGSGCIFIRATIMETPDTWYMDDPNLVLKICQDSKAEADNQGPVLNDCCACEEAKYEVTFEGLWSRNTHPKDFPSKGWIIRFSDVIGASHTVDYRFWKYNGMASTGLQQVAEFGLTRKLESELKDQSDHIRTIIKARGISYPNVTGKTFAVFRVDRKHHLMSLVSMIDPSPDWIVGVSGLELCLSNCSWIEHKELNLYPYDAGTDNGITYLSPDSPTEPQEPIHRITSSYPNDSRSPFYDPSGLDMKPLARLYLNRQRLYEKTCVNISGDTMNTGTTDKKRRNTEACKVTSWHPWEACSVTCGRGTRLRQRFYEDKVAATQNKCNVSLTGRAKCQGESLHCNNRGQDASILETEKCTLQQWSSWSSCSATCGNSHKTRSRNFKYKKHLKECKSIPDGPVLQQTIACEYILCPDVDKDENCPEERYTQWSLWSPCSSTCGPGIQLRFRLVKEGNIGSYDENLNREECKRQQATCVANIPTCNITKEEAEKICNEPMEKGRCNSNIIRVYFDKQTGQCRRFSYSGCDGNRNNFETEKYCNEICGDFQKESRGNISTMTKNYKVSLSSVLSYHIPVQGQRSMKTKRAHHEKLKFKGIQPDSQVIESSNVAKNIDCQISNWSNWSACAGCRGYTESTRQIQVYSKGNGKKCPQKLHRKRKCHKIPPCSLQGDELRRRTYRDRYSGREENQISVDCKMTQWSSWSHCTATCGKASQYRTRTVKIQSVGPKSKPCSHMIENRKCHTIECL